MIHTLSALSPATISSSISSTPDSAHRGAGMAVLATLLIRSWTEMGVASASRLIAMV